VLGGKIEFETGEEGREHAILEHLLRTAIADTARSYFRGLDSTVLVEALREGVTVMTGEQVSAADVLAAMPVLGESDLYDEAARRLGANTPSERAGAMELLLESLYLERRIGKDTVAGETVYG
jgi:magnesium chelatase subunit I